MAIDINAIMPRHEFEARMDDLIATVKACPTATDAEVLVPGELENRAVDRAAGTVSLVPATVAEINTLAVRAGVPTLPEE